VRVTREAGRKKIEIILRLSQTFQGEIGKGGKCQTPHLTYLVCGGKKRVQKKPSCILVGLPPHTKMYGKGRRRVAFIRVKFVKRENQKMGKRDRYDR